VSPIRESLERMPSCSVDATKGAPTGGVKRQSAPWLLSTHLLRCFGSEFCAWARAGSTDPSILRADLYRSTGAPTEGGSVKSAPFVLLPKILVLA
jgi:hypothetical protein